MSNLAVRGLSIGLLRPAALLAGRRRSGLTLLVALASFTVFGLAVLALAALAIGRAAALAWREVGGRRRIVLANEDLCPVGQIGKPGRHHAIRRRQAAGDHGIALVLLYHHDRLGGCNITLADHVAEGAGGPALHRRGRHHDRL